MGNTVKRGQPIRLDRTKVYGGDNTLKVLRAEFVLDASYDEYLGDIVDKVIAQIDQKYPDGMPEDTRHIHSFDGGTVHAFTQGKGEDYTIALWSDGLFHKAMADKGVTADIVFDPSRLTEWQIPEAVV